ncbi:MAG: beta-ketoacyl-ACP synthase [Sandaracinaceae bacterium]|nr:beta-ketoacyl-ACP synthase [Sandaracinaceae bacterium]MBK6810705.1 beta-ketoacyl-ACP synthase [Sandaracinaceae bacterium]
MRVTPYPVTAYGLACGLGRDTASVLAQLRRGERGLSPVPLDVPFMTVTGTIPGELPELDSRIAEHDSRLARVTQLGFESIASEVARAVSQWGPSRVACVLGTSTGGIRATELAHAAHHHEGTLPASFDYRTQHPFHITTDICRKLGGFSGPAYIVSTACSSSGKVFASARRLLDAGLADAVLVGGADALCHTTVRGFFSLGVMAEGPCMPFSADRPGMNIGEGAAFALVERSGTPRAMLLGVGESSDAFHPSSPHPEGRGALAAMAHALEQAGLTATDVDYVNAHGTGTKHNDSAESQAVETLLGREVPVVSTKGYTGHTLGACGAVEAIFGIVSIEEGFLPASVGSTPRDPEITIHVPSERLDLQPRYVLSNSFAFGGNNCSVLLGRPA